MEDQIETRVFIFRRRDGKCLFLSECEIEEGIGNDYIYMSGQMQNERRGREGMFTGSASSQTEVLVAPATIDVKYGIKPTMDAYGFGEVKIHSVTVDAFIPDDEYFMGVDGILQVIEMPSYAHRWK